MGRKLFAAAPEPKEFYDIEDAGHNDTFIIGGKPYFDALQRFITTSLSAKNKNKG